jgi:hypothetical protein
LDVEGRPICCEMWPGNTADVKTLIPIVKRMKERFRLREITVVADRGMVSQATLEAFEKSEPPVRYIVGVRMRRQKEVNTSVLGSRARWFESVPERSNAKDPAPLKVKEVWVKERRYIVCLNEEERRKDAHDREAIVAQLKEHLRNGDMTRSPPTTPPGCSSGSGFHSERDCHSNDSRPPSARSWSNTPRTTPGNSSRERPRAPGTRDHSD